MIFETLICFLLKFKDLTNTLFFIEFIIMQCFILNWSIIRLSSGVKESTFNTCYEFMRIYLILTKLKNDQTFMLN